MKHNQYLMVFVIALICLFISCSEELPRPADDFYLKSIDGRRISLSNLKGKVVVLNFWASWCPACQEEIPWFVEVYGKYKNQGLEIVGLSIEVGKESEVASFSRSYKISYPVCMADSDLVSDYGPIDYVPTTFIVNKDGDIVYKHVGGITPAQLESIVKPLLGLEVD